MNLSNAYAEIRGSGDKLKVILDPTQEDTMSPQARQAVTVEMGKNISHLAVVSRKKHIRLLGNFFLKMKDLGFELKLFHDEEKAKEWLDSF